MARQRDKYNINRIKSSLGRFGTMNTSLYQVEFGFTNQVQNILDASRTTAEEINLRASKVALPGREIGTIAAKPFGVDYEHPTELKFEKNLAITFLNDKNNFLRRFFTGWQKLVIDDAGVHGFREEYGCSMKIISETNDARTAAEFEFSSVYPRVIQGNEFTAAAPNFVEFDVAFEYIEAKVTDKFLRSEQN